MNKSYKSVWNESTGYGSPFRNWRNRAGSAARRDARLRLRRWWVFLPWRLRVAHSPPPRGTERSCFAGRTTTGKIVSSGVPGPSLGHNGFNEPGELLGWAGTPGGPLGLNDATGCSNIKADVAVSASSGGQILSVAAKYRYLSKVDVQANKIVNVAAGVAGTDAVNLSQLNGADKYFHVNSTEADSSATATNAIAIGPNAKASGEFSNALGRNASATGYAASVLGATAAASGDYSTAVGVFSNAAALGSVGGWGQRLGSGRCR